MIRLFLFFLLMTLCLARESPNADLVRNLEKENAARYSSDVIEDALMDVPELIRKYGYPLEVHKVVTSDGYVLELHRIPGNFKPINKYPVLVNHGMFGSSADFVISGPGNALAYKLHDEGYDVWLLNARGNYYSRDHISVDPKTSDFWKFSWDEIGNIDLADCIDYILRITESSKVHFVTHSQGGTTYFVLTTLKPEYNDKIASVHAMAPAVFNSQADRPELQAIAPYLGIAERIMYRYWRGEMFPNTQILTELAINLCHDETENQLLCTQAFHSFAGESDMLNSTMIPVILGHSPAGASFRQIVHFAQLIVSNDFRRYDYGRLINLAVYRSPRPPKYPLDKSTAPVHIYYGLGDIAVAYEDLVLLKESIPNCKELYQIEYERFNHIDFLYGSRANEFIYEPIVKRMEDYNYQF